MLPRFLIVPICLISFNVDAENATNPVDNFKKYGLALEAIFGMGIRLQYLLDHINNNNATNITTRSDKGNFVVSPISATTIIAQLMLGAEEPFREQLYDLLQLPKSTNLNIVNYYGKNKKNESINLPHADLHLQLSSLLKFMKKNTTKKEFILKQENAVFVDEDIKLKKRFEKNMEIFYDSYIRMVDFKLQKDQPQALINYWINESTNGLIPELFSDPLPSTTQAIFVNTVYFLAKWQTPFSDELNQVAPFSISETENSTVTYMRGIIEQIPYKETENYYLLGLPYENNELFMYIILPHDRHPLKYKIDEFATLLTPDDVLRSLQTMKLTDVTLKMPKLELTNTIHLLEPLKKYCAYKQFHATRKNNSKTNETKFDNLFSKIDDFEKFNYSSSEQKIELSAAAENETLNVSDIVQKMVFKVNENGTEAAAVTASISDKFDSQTVRLDRPFSFFIRHDRLCLHLR